MLDDLASSVHATLNLFTTEESKAGEKCPTLDKKELEKRWWDAADLRIIDAVQAGQMPALVGAWSYYILEFGADRLKEHWSEMLARWSAFPVFWCVAGEVGLMEYKDLFADDMQAKALSIQQMWKPVISHVRNTDSWKRPITVHPCPAFNYSSTEALQGDESLDFIWLQTGHADVNVIKATLGALNKAQRDSKLPVINSEVCYKELQAVHPRCCSAIYFGLTYFKALLVIHMEHKEFGLFMMMKQAQVQCGAGFLGKKHLNFLVLHNWD
jgi:hypothetical protein